jgi:hypothetical protein
VGQGVKAAMLVVSGLAVRMGSTCERGLFTSSVAETRQ